MIKWFNEGLLAGGATSILLLLFLISDFVLFAQFAQFSFLFYIFSYFCLLNVIMHPHIQTTTVT
jgi:hypothetical protein